MNAGARPVFCDVDLDTRNVTPETVRAALTPATTAIVAVDLFGCPVPVPELRALGLPMLEDAAQAAGASLDGRRAGALGDAATFSFYPSKNLACLGDGGAIATDDDDVAELARTLRFHGSRDKRSFEYVGYNSRLDELQAAVLRVAAAGARRLVRGPSRGGPRVHGRRLGRARRSAAGPGWRGARVAPVRRDPCPRRRAARRRCGSAASRRAATTACRFTASRRWRHTCPTACRCRSPTSSRAPTSHCRSARCWTPSRWTRWWPRSRPRCSQ